VLLRVLVVFLLIPYSLMAPKFLRYALPMLATVDLIAAVGLVSGIGWLLRKTWLLPATRVAAATFAIGLAGAQQAAAPFYSLFENGIGVRVDPHRAAFPEATYDYGVREAVDAIARAASPSAVIASDAPAVVAHYLDRADRGDIRVRSLSGGGAPAGPGETWVIAQDEHRTFENALLLDALRSRVTPWREIWMNDLLAARVFRIPGR